MVTLREKFVGCIAGSWVGSAMGAAVEGWSVRQIAQAHGRLEQLLPYKHYTGYTDWQRPPGTTEDGIERQKLIATAIIRKGGRVLAEDLLAVWKSELDPAKMIYKQEPFDRALLELARSGVPAVELGRMWPFANVVSVARASHPLGLINAGDPRSAAEDTFEVGKVYAAETTPALRWAALYNAAVAEACRPEATVESVLGVVRQFASYRAGAAGAYRDYDSVEREIGRALDLAARHPDPAALREAIYPFYEGGNYITYGQSQANEVVAKGLAIFAATAGQPREAIVAAVNFGRDTDCTAAVAGGLAGALAGAEAIPAEWIAQVNEATRADPYTNSARTIEETAAALLEAFVRHHAGVGAWFKQMGEGGYLA